MHAANNACSLVYRVLAISQPLEISYNACQSPSSYLSQTIAVLTRQNRERLCTDFKGIDHSVILIFNIQREDRRLVN